MKCHDCGIEVALPFTCSCCGQRFCMEHRLPENHLCILSPIRPKPPINTHKKHGKYYSEGNFHFIRNPHHRQRKRLKRAMKTITSLIVVAILGYLIWREWPFTQVSQEVIESVFPHNTDDEIETEIFQMINAERASRGLLTLQNNTKLTLIAKSWGIEIAIAGNLAHGDFASRIESIGFYTIEFQCGEIIESYSSTPGASAVLARIFVDGWLGSSGHKAIMLTELGGFMGVGVCRSGSMLYGVVDFAFVVN